jgi:hypothetical protein
MSVNLFWRFLEYVKKFLLEHFMMLWEKRIIEAFMERYPMSAAATGGRPLRLKAEKLFPDFEIAQPDERESFLEAAEHLEKRGLVSLVWKSRHKGEELRAIVCIAGEAIFAAAGQVSPSFRLLRAQDAARHVGQPLFDFIAENIDTFDAVRGLDEQAVIDLTCLISFIEENGNEILCTPRALSISLYTDSKRLELLLSMFNRVLSKAISPGIVVPDFSSFTRSYPETMVAGNLLFRLRDPTGTDGHRLVNEGGNVLGLPLMTVEKICSIRCLRAGKTEFKALMVENKETFYALCSPLIDIDCLVYVGGYPNGAVQKLISMLAASNFMLYHAGDLDIDGIRIFQEVARCAGKPVTPLRMDVETFNEYSHCARKLEKSMLQNMHLINESVRATLGIAELISRIQTSGLGIEQEIIDYRAALRALGA